MTVPDNKCPDGKLAAFALTIASVGRAYPMSALRRIDKVPVPASASTNVAARRR